MQLNFTQETTKEKVFCAIEEYLKGQQLTVSSEDRSRPWGGFFVIEEALAEKFIRCYFPHLAIEDLMIGNRLSPKILVVAPNKRLSWQYHHRRAEVWKLIGGKAAVVTSDNDVEKDTVHLEMGDVVHLKQGERHRLIGMDGWGIIAEIWQHTDPEQPSDESDIIRVQDDFGR